jgi:outer membrane protein
MRFLRTKFLLFTLFILRGVCDSFAQQSSILDSYIKEGLSSNMAFKTQQFDLEKSYIALQEAETLFKPRVNFQTQYSLAVGGRSIEFPLGDLLNNAYSTLNKLTKTNDFPQLQNQSVKFLPNNFHETKIRTTYPLVNKEIFYNREIKKELITIEQAKIKVYKRELVKTIKMAYIQYLQAQQAVIIYKNALGLVNENLRVNQKLVKNDVATNAQVLKAQTEVSKVQNNIVESENNAKNAAAYFNFLLNKPFDTEINIDAKLTETFYPTESSFPLQQGAQLQQKREEFAQIQGGQRATALVLKMNETSNKPKMGLLLDAGFQGYLPRIWDKQAFALLGFQLDMPLYNANVNKLKAQQSQIELNKLDAQNAEVLQQIQLQVQVAKTNFITAKEALKVNDAEKTSSSEYYRLTERRFREGQALQIELVDARTQMTMADLKRSLAHFTVLMRMIELERAAAEYNLN